MTWQWHGSSRFNHTVMEMKMEISINESGHKRQKKRKINIFYYTKKKNLQMCQGESC